MNSPAYFAAPVTLARHRRGRGGADMLVMAGLRSPDFLVGLRLRVPAAACVSARMTARRARSILKALYEPWRRCNMNPLLGERRRGRGLPVSAFSGRPRHGLCETAAPDGLYDLSLAAQRSRDGYKRERIGGDRGFSGRCNLPQSLALEARPP